jgi:hypothetical protein
MLNQEADKSYKLRKLVRSRRYLDAVDDAALLALAKQLRDDPKAQAVVISTPLAAPMVRALLAVKGLPQGGRTHE